MTKRTPVSSVQNIWYNSQQVDNTDLTLEQNYNDTITSSVINNHIGTGVLQEALIQNILFDSLLTSSALDGYIVYTQNQPSDNNFGNQLEIELSASKVAGNKTIKLCIVGLDFESNLQYETFVFKTNEVQVGEKHFTQILALLFNDISGETSTSFNLGGRVLIREAKPFALSRSLIMVSQDKQPNLFFRDFYPSTILTSLQSALPYYNIDTLNISTSAADYKYLLNGDVSTQIGQKFLATTNNIQKITLLLSVRNQISPTQLDWQGDLILSVYELQTTLSCSTDFAPNLEIGFTPSNIPIAQLSEDYLSLSSKGIVLNEVAQPVDFILSSSQTAPGNTIIPGKYYAFTLKRSGSANKCDIIISVGTNSDDNLRITTYNGNVWTDLPDQSLWFKVWTDAAKVSDGQAYDTGHGIYLPKTILDTATQTTVDYCLDNLQFNNNDVYTAVLSATVDQNTSVPDQRTGQPVLTRKQYVPEINLLNPTSFSSLSQDIDPLILGNISDKNIKYYDPLTSLISTNLYKATIIKDSAFMIFDGHQDIELLDGYFVNGMFVNAKFTTKTTSPTIFYRIADTKIYSYILGDTNNDGIIDANDLDILNSYIGYNLNIGLPLLTTIGLTEPIIYTNGYKLYTSPFVNETITSGSTSFCIIDSSGNIITDSAGLNYILTADGYDVRRATFNSSDVDFSTLSFTTASCKLVVYSSLYQNKGVFEILGLDTSTNELLIRKVYLNDDTMLEIIKSDVNKDGYIDTDDSALLVNYIDKSNTSSYVGTSIRVIHFKLEQFTDRKDDYNGTVYARALGIHVAPDIFVDNSEFYSYDYSIPKQIQIEKQFYWEDYVVVVNNNPKIVPSIFSTLIGYTENLCQLPSQITSFPIKGGFDPGRIDYFVPNNLIINDGGEIVRPTGDLYKVDFEVGTIVLEMPDAINGPYMATGTVMQKYSSDTVSDSTATFDSSYINKFLVITSPASVAGTYQIIYATTTRLRIICDPLPAFTNATYFVFNPEKTVNIFDKFICEYSSTGYPIGLTRIGYPAMKFADCSYVQSSALLDQQIRFSVSAQSFSPNIDGYNFIDGYGTIVDGKIGTYMDYETGILTVNFTNLYTDTVYQTLNTRIQVNVFLKKAGFNNNILVIDADTVKNILV